MTRREEREADVRSSAYGAARECGASHADAQQMASRALEAERRNPCRACDLCAKDDTVA
jgi:hypothetical protein